MKIVELYTETITNPKYVQNQKMQKGIECTKDLMLLVLDTINDQLVTDDSDFQF